MDAQNVLGLARSGMIHELTIQNFKCFEKRVRIPFSKINILYGKNGRGKSSALQTLLLLSQSLRSSNGGVDTLALNGDMVSLGTFEDIKSRYIQGQEHIILNIRTDEESELRLDYVEDPKRPTLACLDDIWVGEQHLKIEVGATPEPFAAQKPEDGVKSFLPLSDNKTLKLLRNILYVSADRRGPVNFEARNDKVSTLEMDTKGENIINLLSTQTKEFIDLFAEELSYVLSGASVRVYANPDTPDRIELFLDSRDDNEAKGFRPKNVGFGYSYVLPIIYQTMIAPEGRTIIVENPEAHLYPGAQSRLVEFLVKYSNKKKLQLILETHSDHIINGLRLAVKKSEVHHSDVSILFFNREEDEKGNPTIDQILVDSNGTLSEEPRDFMDEWTRQMLALL